MLQVTDILLQSRDEILEFSVRRNTHSKRDVANLASSSAAAAAATAATAAAELAKLDVSSDHRSSAGGCRHTGWII